MEKPVQAYSSHAGKTKNVKRYVDRTLVEKRVSQLPRKAAIAS